MKEPQSGLSSCSIGFFAWAIREVDVRSEFIGHAHTVFWRCMSGSNTARDALYGLALTESRVFALLNLFHFRGIDALEIE